MNIPNTPEPDEPFQSAILRQGPPPIQDGFIVNLDAAIKFHQTNANDSLGIGNAVICALLEVRNAYAKAIGMPLKT
jgi:hypothetical protein